MKLLSGDGLRKDILESYFKNHKEWSFVISPSPEHGFYDAIVSGPDGAWMLKIDSLFKPVPIVIGSPVEAKPRSFHVNWFSGRSEARAIHRVTRGWPASCHCSGQKLLSQKGEDTTRKGPSS